MSRTTPVPRGPARFLVPTLVLALNIQVPVQALSKTYVTALPSLNPEWSLLAVENRPVLFDRLVLAFGGQYSLQYMANPNRPLANGMAIYYARQELQALIDMWRATGREAYLDLATNVTLYAMTEACARPGPLLLYGQSRGVWPCFYHPTVAAQTGGHSQLCDFQGSAGFLGVARALRELDRPEWKTIADFVRDQVVVKWLYYRPSITQAQLTGPTSARYLLATLNSARDVREHFACICLDLDELGYDDHPYREWAELLIDLYLTLRYEPDEAPPRADELSDRIPTNWGLFVRSAPRGYLWLSVPNYDPNRLDEPMDTSHTNRTAWLAARAYSEGLVDWAVIEGLIHTLRLQIWTPSKGPFYFTNYIDGSDGTMGGLAEGRAGNVWFGWHRLAVYDEVLRALFISLAYDLTDSGSHLPSGAQNKTMVNAPTCLQAWAARLLTGKGQPLVFP